MDYELTPKELEEIREQVRIAEQTELAYAKILEEERVASMSFAEGMTPEEYQKFISTGAED